MAKGYWLSAYRAIKNPDKLAAYAKLAGPAIQGAGGRFLVRSPSPVKTYEAGVASRTVIIEFDSVEKAIAAHDSPAYQEALRALGDGAERDLRILEGA
jgi:uncharacterized protein (DUF1330 family)